MSYSIFSSNNRISLPNIPYLPNMEYLFIASKNLRHPIFEVYWTSCLILLSTNRIPLPNIPYLPNMEYLFIASKNLRRPIFGKYWTSYNYSFLILN
jgi:hypothetical protein